MPSIVDDITKEILIGSYDAATAERKIQLHLSAVRLYSVKVHYWNLVKESKKKQGNKEWHRTRHMQITGSDQIQQVEEEKGVR